MESFVSLDLELTPAGGDRQRIIEVAAVRFDGGHVVDSFASLVNPSCDLTHRVEVLTGIRSEELRGAPSFEQIAPRLLEFVGREPLVGQSVEIDLGCLESYGIRLPNLSIDTFELSTILLPGLPSYDLGTIARSLSVQLEQEHRALGDALLAGRVFLALLATIDRLSLEVLSHVSSISSRLPAWPLAGLFAEATRSRLKQHFLRPLEVEQGSQSRGLGKTQGSRHPMGDEMGSPTPNTLPLPTPAPSDASRTALAPSTSRVPINREELRSLLRPGGTVALALSAYEERQEQLQMMDAIIDAFNSGGQMLVEAGTGTGKSLSYLLPSIFFAVRNGRRVVISTNTINLQDQLFLKDIPVLQDALPFRFGAALLKGRANYVCLRRWLALSRSAELGPPEIQLLVKTLLWLSMTEKGDKAELSLSPSDSALWSRICAQAESCAFTLCAQFRRGECFVARARKAAEDAHIIVVNHALLLADATCAGATIPEYSHLIVDEAHHMEEEATDQLGFAISWGELTAFLAALQQLHAGAAPSGFLAELGRALRHDKLPPEASALLRASVASISEVSETAMEEGKSFFEAVDCFLHDHNDERPRNGSRLRITSTVRTQPDWSEIEVRWDSLSERLGGVRQRLLRLEKTLQELESDQMPEREGTLAEIGGQVAFIDETCSRVDEIVSSPTTNGIYWISSGNGLDELTVRSAPLHVGEALNSALFSSKDTVILTSATLTTEGGFDYIKERLSLEEAGELMVGSPFDYLRSTLLYLVQDIPEPTRPSCQRAVESTIAELAIAMEGRTLVLFTSHAQLRLTASSIRSRLQSDGILLLAHGLDGSRRRLLQAFKTSPRAVLMGTNSFWEGIDIVGERLSCLVIVKLPFAVPTDPVFAARSESFEEPFRQFSVPQTILRLKQGFGRLIRSRNDRGVVAILDSRVGSKSYGPAFIHSLPQCTIVRGPEAHVAEQARDWLKRGQSPARPA